MRRIDFRSPSSEKQTYFIADVAANHDGSLDRAVQLIHLAAEAGADAAKFQNFQAKTIVSKKGFELLGSKLAHQAKWEKSVYEVYEAAELPLEWTSTLISACDEAGIEYFTAPYDLKYISEFSKVMPYVKIGSGDITWRASLSAVTNTGLPIILATGASTLQEIDRAVSMIREKNQPYVLMQCNTNYTGDESNFKYLNLNVLKDFAHRYPDAVLGLSDHSDGDVSVLGAVALGARVIEKHFTDDKNRLGPDHKFSMSPDEWRFMVERTRILEKTLGDGNKKVENNELEARVVQRRALRYAAKLPVGKVIEIDDLVSLRPAPADALDPFFDLQVVGKTLVREVDFHDLVSLNDFNP